MITYSKGKEAFTSKDFDKGSTTHKIYIYAISTQKILIKVLTKSKDILQVKQNHADKETYLGKALVESYISRLPITNS